MLAVVTANLVSDHANPFVSNQILVAVMVITFTIRWLSARFSMIVHFKKGFRLVTSQLAFILQVILL